MLHKIITNALNDLGYQTEPLETDDGTIAHIFIWRSNKRTIGASRERVGFIWRSNKRTIGASRERVGHITLNDYPRPLWLYKNLSCPANATEITHADPELIKKIQEFYGPALQWL